MTDHTAAEAEKLPFEPSQMIDYGDASDVTQTGAAPSSVFDNSTSNYNS